MNGPARRRPTGVRRAAPRGRGGGSRRPPRRSTAPPARPRRAAGDTPPPWTATPTGSRPAARARPRRGPARAAPAPRAARPDRGRRPPHRRPRPGRAPSDRSCQRVWHAGLTTPPTCTNRLADGAVHRAPERRGVRSTAKTASCVRTGQPWSRLSISAMCRSVVGLSMPRPLRTPSPFSCSSRASRMCSVPM